LRFLRILLGKVFVGFEVNSIKSLQRIALKSVRRELPGEFGLVDPPVELAVELKVGEPAA
jgi:hypothetical protein